MKLKLKNKLVFFFAIVGVYLIFISLANDSQILMGASLIFLLVALGVGLIPETDLREFEKEVKE